MDDSISILVVGCGSIGERHFRCFGRTGRARVSGCDTNPTLREHMLRQYGTTVFENLDTALANARWDGVVVCTPAHTHVGIALRALEHNCALLIEKPLSCSLDGVDSLRAKARATGKPVAVAYVYHSMPAMIRARDYLLSGELGKVLQVTVTAGQHFPDFRPAYREIYYNRHETGGGAIQDALTHLVNATEWIIGPMDHLYCQAAHEALEGVTVEDTVSVAARHGEVIAGYSLNQFQAPNETTLAFHCEKGSVKIELHEQRWAIFRRGDKAWDYHPAPVADRDDFFANQANSFLDAIEGKPYALCSLDEAIQTLKFNLAALESSRSGQAVPLS